jgi:hypothetical protein
MGTRIVTEALAATWMGRFRLPPQSLFRTTNRPGFLDVAKTVVAYSREARLGKVTPAA